MTRPTTLTRFPVSSQDAQDLRELAEESERDDQAAVQPHDPACRAGWLSEDDEGRPAPCPTCRPWLWNRACPTCATPQSRCAEQRERLGVRCCVDCEHRPAALRGDR